MSREKPGVQSDRGLKLDVVPHRRLHELQSGRDLHENISVWNHDLFRQRIAKEAVKARGMVHIFVRHSKIPGRRFVAGSSGTNGSSENHAPVIRQIGFLVGQIYLDGALGEAADGPGEKDPAEN